MGKGIYVWLELLLLVMLVELMVRFIFVWIAEQGIDAHNQVVAERNQFATCSCYG